MFLNCARLEESLKVLLGAMAAVHAGKLVPADATPILNGTRKLTSGMVYKEILDHLHASTNWTDMVEQALAARNRLIHHYRFSRWDRITTADELQHLEAELKPLVSQVHQGVEVIMPMIKGLLAMIVEQFPHLKAEEWQRVIDSEPGLEISYEPIRGEP